jgi:hypothetical protein
VHWLPPYFLALRPLQPFLRAPVAAALPFRDPFDPAHPASCIFGSLSLAGTFTSPTRLLIHRALTSCRAASSTGPLSARAFTDHRWRIHSGVTGLRRNSEGLRPASEPCTRKAHLCDEAAISKKSTQHPSLGTPPSLTQALGDISIHCRITFRNLLDHSSRCFTGI